MDFMSGKGVVQIVGAYIEREVSECRKVTEKELSAGGIAPEAGSVQQKTVLWLGINEF